MYLGGGVVRGGGVVGGGGIVGGGGREGESDLSQPCQFNQNHLKTSVSSVNL